VKRCAHCRKPFKGASNRAVTCSPKCARARKTELQAERRGGLVASPEEPPEIAPAPKPEASRKRQGRRYRTFDDYRAEFPKMPDWLIRNCMIDDRQGPYDPNGWRVEAEPE
jgi:hypothetical protein